MRSKLAIFLGGIVLAATTLVVLAVPAVRESQTQDEAVYVVSGLSYWRTGDFRLNPEHPPLVKLILSLPAVFRGATFSANASDWNGASQWDISPKVLYHNIAPGHDLLVSARAVNIVFTLGLIALVAAWAWRTFGRGAGIVTALLAAFEPNLLANGHVATTDVTATLAILGSIFTFCLWLERPSWSRSILAASVFSLAVLTRFNALQLIFVLPLLYLTVRVLRNGHWKIPSRVIIRTIAVFLVITFSLTWFAYGFEVRPLNQYQDGPAREVLAGLPSVKTWLETTSLPAMSYLSGLLWQVGHNREGQWAYLFGYTNHQGWPYYFVVAMLIKMTIASLVLAAIGFMQSRRMSRGRDAPVFSVWMIVVPLVVLTGATFTSHLALGVRYVLPSIMLLLIVAGGSIKLLNRSRGWRGVLIGLLAFHVISVVRFFPHWFPYANEVAGGPAKLDQRLIDSNLDWGQDIPLVREYMRTHNISQYYFRAFSTAPTEAYGVTETEIPTDQDVAVTPFRGVIAIGKSVLFYPTMQYRWLQALQPTATLGYSTNVYDLR